MVTLKEFQEEDKATRRDQMEMMFVIGGLMSMMVASLALQHTFYRRVNVAVK